MKDELRVVASDILRKVILPYAKAWAVAVVYWVFGILLSLGLEVPQDLQVTIASGVTAFVVWLVPNIPFIEK